jgi:hypothetical protein
LRAISLIIFFIIMATIITPVGAVSPDEVRSQLIKAFEEVRIAEREGGNVTMISPKLTAAALLIDEGGEDNLSKASALILEVRNAVPTIAAAGSQYIYTRSIITIISVVTLVIIGIMIWAFGSRVYWNIWLRIHNNWRVERT